MSPRRVLIGALLASAIGCAPRLSPLSGQPSPRPIPPAVIPPGSQRLVFQWTLDDPDFIGRGEGAVRVTSPDSARLDFFLAGGLGSGAAVFIGDQMRLPSTAIELSRRVVPPPPMLWAALGRLAVPPAPDTTARVDGDTLRADIGTPVAWRVIYVRDSLRRVEHVEGARIVEWVERTGSDRIRYRQETSRRQLDLRVTRTDHVSAFDALIWVLP